MEYSMMIIIAFAAWYLAVATYLVIDDAMWCAILRKRFKLSGIIAALLWPLFVYVFLVHQQLSQRIYNETFVKTLNERLNEER